MWNPNQVPDFSEPQRPHLLKWGTVPPTMASTQAEEFPAHLGNRLTAAPNPDQPIVPRALTPRLLNYHSLEGHCRTCPPGRNPPEKPSWPLQTVPRSLPCFFYGLLENLVLDSQPQPFCLPRQTDGQKPQTRLCFSPAPSSPGSLRKETEKQRPSVWEDTVCWARRKSLLMAFGHL